MKEKNQHTNMQYSGFTEIPCFSERTIKSDNSLAGLLIIKEKAQINWKWER